MDPWCIVNEFLEEHSRSHGAAPASAGVDDVGDAALDHFLIFLVDRQAPHFFARALQGFRKFLENLFVVRKNAGIDHPQRHYARSGQRCCIDQVGATQLTCVIKTIGKDEAAFSVSIDDLDRFATHCDLHVARLLRFAAGHVFRRAYNADHLHLGLE